MTVLCNCPKLFSLLTDANGRAPSAKVTPEQQMLAQRVSELMAANSLDELVHHKTSGLNISNPPPNPTFTMILKKKTQLVFTVSEPDERITDDFRSWNLVKSVNLLKIER